MRKEDGILFEWVTTICILVLTFVTIYFVYTILDKVETIEKQQMYDNQPSVELQKEMEDYQIKSYLEELEEERE